MSIEDRIKPVEFTDSNTTYYEWILSDIKNWIPRYCKRCGSPMRISLKWNSYCNSICWNDSNVVIKNYYQQWIEQFIYNNTKYD